MQRTELEVGKTYTHSTTRDLSRMELVKIVSLEPQLTSRGNRYGWSNEKSSNLVLVSVTSEFSGKVYERTALLRNLYPAEDYYRELEHRERREAARKATAQRTKELQAFIEDNRDEIRDLLGMGYYHAYNGVVEVKLNKETLEKLLQKAGR